MDQQPTPNNETVKAQKPSIYPEAKYGPLGETPAHYADPRTFAGKPEGDSQNHIIFGGIILTVILVVVLIALVVTKGRIAQQKSSFKPASPNSITQPPTRPRHHLA